MKKTLSLFSANLLNLIILVLVISIGSWAQTLNLPVGLLITEFVLILLPVIIFMRIKKIPLKEGLRLNKIQPVVAVLCLFIGVSLYFFSIAIEVIMVRITGQLSVDIPAELLPHGLVPSLLYFTALAIAAPICEEAVFRGAVQGAYENRKSTLIAIVIPGLMFAFSHFRLSGLPGLLPVSLVLGYVAWRSRSIIGTMLIHLGVNATSAIITLISLNVVVPADQTVQSVDFIQSVPAEQLIGVVCISTFGLIVTFGLLLAFNQLQPKPTGAGYMPELPGRNWFAVYWPLVAGFILYLGVVILTLFIQRTQSAAPIAPEFTPQIRSTSVESRYQAVNRAGDVVGEMACALTPEEMTVSLDCAETIQAYEVTIGNSLWSDSGHSAELHAVWDSSTYQLLEYRKVGTFDSGGEQVSELNDGSLITTSFFDTYEPLPLTGNSLLELEWVWRVNNLDISSTGANFNTPVVYLMRWDEDLKRSGPLQQNELLSVGGEETLSLPAGEFRTWKVTLGSQSAWYGVEDTNSPRPVQFDDGMLIYSLMPE